MAFLSMFAGPLIVLALIGGLYGTHKLAVWNAGRVATNIATAQCDADKEIIRKRATDMALLAAKRLDEIGAAQSAAESRQRETFGTLAERAAAVQRGGGIAMPFDVVSVRRSASAAANVARPAQVGPRTAAPLSRSAETTERIVEQPQIFDEPAIADDEVKKAAAYASAYGKWQGCVNAYDAVRNATKADEPRGFFDWFNLKGK